MRSEAMGVDVGKGKGGRLAIWYRWWQYAHEGKTISEIADVMVETQDGFKTYTERTIRKGIADVKKLMRPVVFLGDP